LKIAIGMPEILVISATMLLIFHINVYFSLGLYTIGLLIKFINFLYELGEKNNGEKKLLHD